MLNNGISSKVASYAEKGASRDTLSLMLRASNSKQLVNAVKQIFDLSHDNCMLLWKQLIYEIYDSNNENTILNERETIFFKQLISSGGCLRQSEIKKIKIFNSYAKLKKAVDGLSDMGLIDVMSMNNYEILYVLSYDFYKEVIIDEKER